MFLRIDILYCNFIIFLETDVPYTKYIKYTLYFYVSFFLFVNLFILIITYLLIHICVHIDFGVRVMCNMWLDVIMLHVYMSYLVKSESSGIIKHA